MTTPGPWFVGADGNHVGTGGAGPMVALIGPEDWQAIARGAGVPAFPTDAAERLANAYVIAGAPLMLAELQVLQQWFAIECARTPPDAPWYRGMLERAASLTAVLERVEWG